MKTKINLLILVMLMIGLAASAQQVCTQYGTVSIQGGQYVVQNNVWGATTAQCVNATTNGFSVVSSSHNLSTSGSPAAYPSVYKGCHWEDCTTGSGMPIQVSAIQNATINWNNTLISSGAWNCTSEAWFKTNSTPGEPDGAELMIWINAMGPQPGGSQIATASIAGYTWEVWYASIGWNFITYRITTPMSSINIDYRPFINDAISRGYIQNSWYMMDIEAGFELWQGGAGLTCNSFTATINGGGVATPTRTATTTPSRTATQSSVSKGDVNGDGTITIVDALMIAQYTVGLNPSPFNTNNADVNCDGSITIVDALITAQRYVGLISSFPC